MDYRIDRNRKKVAADLAGLVTSRLVFLGAEGCRVAHQGAASAQMHDDPPTPAKHAAKPLPVDPVSPAFSPFSALRRSSNAAAFSNKRRGVGPTRSKGAKFGSNPTLPAPGERGP